MNTNLTEPTTLSPVSPAERLQSLDVIRGFALFGIFLMNVEFFNRPSSELGQGMQLGLTGIDWFASWFVNYFVQGKFWTIFSLLFGMGFAIMLSRAEQAQRPFLGPYLRRIVALATFGAAHYIFLWAGDILFSYAMGAGALLVLLYGRWKPIVGAILLLIAAAIILRMGLFGAYAASLTFVGLVALYLRSEYRVNLRFARVPVFSFILLILGTVAAVFSALFAVSPEAPYEAKVGTPVVAVTTLIFGVLAAKYHQPQELRGLRLGVGIYLFSTVMMTSIGAVMYLAPPDDSASLMAAGQTESVVAAALPDETAAEEPASGDTADLDEPSEGKPDEVDNDSTQRAAETVTEDPDQARADRAAEAAAERQQAVEDLLERIREETEVLSKGSYFDGVYLNASRFAEKMTIDAGMSILLIAMFLIGYWFVQSGIMRETRAHLPLFRKLAIYGLPLGIGLGLLGSLIAVSHTPGDTQDGYQFAYGLLMLGNLPACLGYVGVVVLMLHSDRTFSRISYLAPAGRMALTHYILQSIVSALIFFGGGLGLWGLPRSLQLLYVVLFFALQVAFSHWWLSRFRYGPLEWLWRGFTYRITPPMRL